MCEPLLVHDYVLGLCYVIPCEWSYVSINYFQRLEELGIFTILEKIV